MGLLKALQRAEQAPVLSECGVLLLATRSTTASRCTLATTSTLLL
jgi:hypothetical protein